MNISHIKEENGVYTIKNPLTESEIINLAKYVISKKFQKGIQVKNSTECMDFLITSLAEYENEVFCVLFLNTNHQLISFDKMWEGSVDHVEISPREIAKRALKYNATAVILAHNHPSGNTESSSADIAMTKNLQAALMLFEIKILDHIIVGADEAISLYAKLEI
jgi:DNA repair protein RadC